MSTVIYDDDRFNTLPIIVQNSTPNTVILPCEREGLFLLR